MEEPAAMINVSRERRPDPEGEGLVGGMEGELDFIYGV
jgi:hypothetical protein